MLPDRVTLGNSPVASHLASATSANTTAGSRLPIGIRTWSKEFQGV
ncbi:hypothetical protein [Alloactinosynnema sp. L-07]|nr:hypothetical protein [Alloactinosynnema sp. L-07]